MVSRGFGGAVYPSPSRYYSPPDVASLTAGTQRTLSICMLRAMELVQSWKMIHCCPHLIPGEVVLRGVKSELGLKFRNTAALRWPLADTAA